MMAEPNIGLLLYLPYRELETRIFDAVRAAGYDDMTLAQSRVFQRIAVDGSRLTDLAERARVTKQTAGFLVDQLVKAGYVTRVVDPADARARLIRVSERGSAAARFAAEVLAEVEAEWTAHLGERTMTQLRHALVKLREITDADDRPVSGSAPRR
ncbi:MarR family winged helix-turn-helix transcriptional regulator [Rhodococcus daqingensis]|uniref:MarR family winged helix-turn-helix transcriptional regulator n=1 Tax=Rhodococcus daqingensis TaxID=2479363 RepID=A0ABW2S1U1_9NOCA